MEMIQHRKRNRLSGYDYSQNGYYFVTLCSQNRIEYFGDVIDETMVLSLYGEIVSKYWAQIPLHYNGVLLDEWIIMPNHLHAIVAIDTTSHPAHPVGTAHCAVPTGMNVKTRHYGLLSKIIKSCKEACDKEIRKINPNFSWQRSFYDHIIRDETGLEKIREYIRNNPLQWELDKDNPENLYM